MCGNYFLVNKIKSDRYPMLTPEDVFDIYRGRLSFQHIENEIMLSPFASLA